MIAQAAAPKCGLSFIPVFMAWRDYEQAKELLDTRDCDVPDIE